MVDGRKHSEDLQRQNRLLKRNDFQMVFQEGQRLSSRRLLIVSRRNYLGFSRLGMAIGKHVGGAVFRNRLKRHIREAFRRSPWVRGLSRDIVVVAKNVEADYCSRDIREDFETLVKRLSRRGPKDPQ